jgi:hypothetical protein
MTADDLGAEHLAQEGRHGARPGQDEHEGIREQVEDLAQRL